MPRILIADDDGMSRKLLQGLLAKWGFEALMVDNGEDAHRVLTGPGAPSLAILDWMMPGMDGVELCRKLRHIPAATYQYILLLTAKEDKNDIVQGLEAGADDYLTKPFHASELHARLRSGMRILDLQENLIRSNVALAEQAARQRRLEADLRESQKLEALGTLAAGVAHEINTPLQFVGDNLRFLQDGFSTLHSLHSQYRKTIAEAAGQEVGDQDGAEMDSLMEEIPRAIGDSLMGLNRVAAIVVALKEFVHPDTESRVPADLNEAIRRTLLIAGSECRNVAEMEQTLGELPPVTCCPAEISRVFLNLVLNAVDAIREAGPKRGQVGKIRISSRADDREVQLSVSDNGCGIPEAIREKVFDPFFTTKEVGKGSGQGLAIARAVIEKHHGSLTFQSEVGVGTTFLIRLPVAERPAPNPIDLPPDAPSGSL